MILLVLLLAASVLVCVCGWEPGCSRKYQANEVAFASVV